MHWFPKTKIGKTAFWLGVSGVVVIYAQYILSMLMQESDTGFMRIFKIVTGIAAMLCALIAGVISIIAITKHRDRAILLFVPVVIGIMGLLLVLGELFIPH